MDGQSKSPKDKLEVVLKSDVEIERIRSVDETDANESATTAVVFDSNDKVASRIGHTLDRNAGIGVDGTSSKELTCKRRTQRSNMDKHLKLCKERESERG